MLLLQSITVTQGWCNEGHLAPSIIVAELVIRVRLADSTETDFLEIELEKTRLTYQALVDAMCSALHVEPRAVRKVRKLPNVIVRKDKDVARLVDFQELELFITDIHVYGDDVHIYDNGEEH